MSNGETTSKQLKLGLIRCVFIIMLMISLPCFHISADKIHCPKNDTAVTLLYQFYPGLIEAKEENMTSTSIEKLESMKGTIVNFFTEFFDQCPRQYHLRYRPYSQQLKEALNKEKEFIIMLPLTSDFLHDPKYFYLYQVTQPAHIFPASIVYMTEMSTHVSLSVFRRYGVVYACLIVLGILIYLMLERFETRDDSQRNYGEVAWKFIVSPFGLCDETLMKTLPMKIFTFTWLAIWFLMVGFFWAEMSSNMTVSKLHDELESFQDVLTSKRQFFWTKVAMTFPQAIVRNLRSKYEGYADEEHRAYENMIIFNTSLSVIKSSTERFLRDNEVLLTWLPYTQLRIDKKLLQDPHLVINMDWSLPLTLHFVMSKNSADTCDALNELIVYR